MTDVSEPHGRHRIVTGNDTNGVRAVFFDFGGVMTTSPFEAFASYEAANGLPDGFIRSLNARDHHANAWAGLERGELTLAGFAAAFAAEADAAGFQIDGTAVLGLLGGQLRPRMVNAVRTCRQRYLTAVATNNFAVGTDDGPSPAKSLQARHADVLALFDTVIESSKIGIRKPEPAFYEACCASLGVRPAEAVFIDDLGVNLKPARELGMITIKFVSESQALADLEAALQLSLGLDSD